MGFGIHKIEDTCEQFGQNEIYSTKKFWLTYETAVKLKHKSDMGMIFPHHAHLCPHLLTV